MSRRLGVFASGRGSNFEAILQAIQAGELDTDIAVLISDKEHAPALETAKAHGIPAVYHPYDRHDRETFAQFTRRQELDTLLGLFQSAA